MEQYSVYPRAIADENGCPLKGSKSVWKEKLCKRYTDVSSPVISDMLPDQWSPDGIIIDAMFLNNCKPLRNVPNITDYSTFLFKRFVLPYLAGGARPRRDQGKELSHQHLSFSPSTKPPTNWRSFIECRQCKRSIIEAIGLAFIQSVRLHLRQGEVLYMSGCFGENNSPTLGMSENEMPTQALSFNSNSPEADMRIWRHVAQTTARQILIFSPDTDIYNIGLPLLQKFPQKILLFKSMCFICKYAHMSV